MVKALDIIVPKEDFIKWKNYKKNRIPIKFIGLAFIDKSKS